jgi:hypothetical protein
VPIPPADTPPNAAFIDDPAVVRFDPWFGRPQIFGGPIFGQTA